MPGYERYQRFSREITNAVKLGIVTVTWTNEGKAFDYQKDGKRYHYDIAAHLATTERECFEPRIRSMAAGERPEFEYYSNDERDFDGVTLQNAVSEWVDTRARLIDFVSGLSEEERARVGVHTKFGELTVDGYLKIALDHDQDHLKSLERLATEVAH